VNIRKIYVVAALHGDEPFGLKVLANLRYFNENRQIVSKVGHPEAVAKRKEFVEINLNRAFGPDAPPSKETQIANFIKNNIAYHKPDLIIDIHTCECSVGKSVIICDRNPELIMLAKRLAVDYVFEGVPHLNKRSLLGQHPKKTLVIELGTGLRSDRLAETLAKSISELIKPSPPESELPMIKFYSKSKYLLAKDAKGQKLENYKFNNKLNGYPYLVGKNSYARYSDYVGFISAKEEIL
jgi:succinylglutamate desuccinylase